MSSSRAKVLMVLRIVLWKYLLVWFSVFKLNSALRVVMEGWIMKGVEINWHDKTEVQGCHPLSFFLTRSIKLLGVGLEVNDACCIITPTLSWQYNNRLGVGVNGQKKSIMSDKTAALKKWKGETWKLAWILYIEFRAVSPFSWRMAEKRSCHYALCG